MSKNEELLQRQDELQSEADEVSADLALEEALARFGEPVRVGSAALGLMIHRDLDVTVVCPRLDAATLEAVAQLGARLAVLPNIRQVQFRDDTGRWNTDPAYPDGVYLGLRYRTQHGLEWNLDIWFVDEPDRQPDLDHVRTLPARLTSETRVAILGIKEAMAGSERVTRVRGYDVYRAVLDDGVRTPEEFEKWARARG